MNTTSIVQRKFESWRPIGCDEMPRAGERFGDEMPEGQPAAQPGRTTGRTLADAIAIKVTTGAWIGLCFALYKLFATPEQYWQWFTELNPITVAGFEKELRSLGFEPWRVAIRTERSSLSRSKASRRPFFLITISSRNCTRSKVVNRAPQPSHWRRRRIAALSSVGRESFTWLSSWAQKGHLNPYIP